MTVEVATLTVLLGSASGGVFAGPTALSGSSSYWGPAALATSPDAPRVMLEGTAFLFDVSYQRAAEDPAREPDYPEVGFTSLAPDFSFTVHSPTPWSWLRVYAGGFSPAGGGTRWPKDGPQRYHATDGTSVTYALMAGLVWTPSPRFGLSAGAGPLYAYIALDAAYDFGAFTNSKLPPGAALFELEDPAMEGELAFNVSGWSSIGVLSAFAEPLDGLRLAATFIAPQTMSLDGEVDVSAPPALDEALPDSIVNPHGAFALRYPVPWVAHAEAELVSGAWTAAAMFQYVRRSKHRVLYGRVVESESGFIEGDQLSIKETRDKITFGVRLERVVDERLRVAARFDVSPRSIPKEAISPVNLDFTLAEGNLGARWSFSEHTSVDLTYGLALVVPLTVTSSIFNPRADPKSGLSQTSAIGNYDAWAMKLVLAFSTTFGQ